MLDFYSLMTNEQFQQIKSSALSRNMKTKYTPQILAHVSIYNLRRNNHKDALQQVERALDLTLQM